MGSLLSVYLEKYHEVRGACVLTVSGVIEHPFAVYEVRGHIASKT